MTHRVTEAHDRFIGLFEKWNRSINLSAASTRAEIREHVVDSLEIVPFLVASRQPPLAPIARVLDVGSGGGFPVVVAAISCPQIHFVSLEPVHKKHAFLPTAARDPGPAHPAAPAVRRRDAP